MLVGLYIPFFLFWQAFFCSGACRAAWGRACRREADPGRRGRTRAKIFRPRSKGRRDCRENGLDKMEASRRSVAALSLFPSAPRFPSPALPCAARTFPRPALPQKRPHLPFVPASVFPEKASSPARNPPKTRKLSPSPLDTSRQDIKTYKNSQGGVKVPTGGDPPIPRGSPRARFQGKKRRSGANPGPTVTVRKKENGFLASVF